jgi:signal transduction histidine kinase
MQRLLEEVLELSRIGRLVNPPEELSLGELVREAVNMVAGRLEPTGVKVEIAPDLPVVYGDHSRLREVLENLIDNAVKFVAEQPDPRVEIGAREDGEETVFYVRDNGIGIDPRYHEKIFDLFDKLDQNSKGTGVGLAIVKRIVEVHGGRIWVESEGTGKGTTFCFTLKERTGAMKKEE